jgi:hypothetical protein
MPLRLLTQPARGSPSRAPKSAQSDQISFAKQRAGHGAQSVGPIKKPDTPHEVLAFQKRILEQDGKRQSHGSRRNKQNQKRDGETKDVEELLVIPEGLKNGTHPFAE